MKSFKIANFEVCYIPPVESNYRIAKKEMAKVTTNEIKTIVLGASFLMISNLNLLQAKVNVTDFTNKVDKKGHEILALIQVIGYFAALVFAGIDIVKGLKKQDLAGIVAIAVKYAVSVAILYGLPDIFDIFKDLFK